MVQNPDSPKNPFTIAGIYVDPNIFSSSGTPTTNVGSTTSESSSTSISSTSSTSSISSSDSTTLISQTSTTSTPKATTTSAVDDEESASNKIEMMPAIILSLVLFVVTAL